ncbi:MAG: InlB B-repeat-containing protein [Lachnospiraceae bacterium]
MMKRETYERKGWLHGIMLAMLLVCSVMTGILVTEPMTVYAGFTTTQVLAPDTAPGTTLSGNTIYKVTEDVEITQTTAGCDGLIVANNATVVLDIAKDCTLTVKGGDGSGKTRGGAGIYVPSNSTLIILGEGTLVAIGGDGGNATNGQNGYDALYDYISPSTGKGVTGNAWSTTSNYGTDITRGGWFFIRGGAGGKGGDGGGGAGAGIGGRGGNGGSGGSGGNYQYINYTGYDSTYGRLEEDCFTSYNYAGKNGLVGSSGGGGSSGTVCGKIYIGDSVTVNAQGGKRGSDADTQGQPGAPADDQAWRTAWYTTLYNYRDKYAFNEYPYRDTLEFGIFAGGGGAGGSGDALDSDAPGIGGGIGGGAGGNGGGSGGVLSVKLSFTDDIYDIYSDYKYKYTASSPYIYVDTKKGIFGGNEKCYNFYLHGSRGLKGGAGTYDGYAGVLQQKRLDGISYISYDEDDAFHNGLSPSTSPSNGASYTTSGSLYMITQKDGKPSLTTSNNRASTVWDGKHTSLAYTLSFDNGNDGDVVTGGVQSRTVYYAAPVTEADNITPDENNTVPQRDGYKFMGYYDLEDKDENGNPKMYYDSTLKRAADAVYKTYGNKTLTAVWKSTKRTIVLNANGGTNGGTTEIRDGQTLGDVTISTPSRTGYTFEGYYYTYKDGYTNANGESVEMWYGPQYTPSSEGDYMEDPENPGKYIPYVEPEEDSSPVQRYTRSEAWIEKTFYADELGLEDGERIELKAKWEPKKYNIELYSNGDYVQTLYNVEYGQLNLPSAETLGISKIHSEFVGWNLYDGQDWAMYKPDITYNTGLVSGNETKVVLYAAWKLLDSYIISYNGNGGSNVPASEYVFLNDSYTISDKIPIKPDYHFVEWNTQVDGTGTSYKYNPAESDTALGEIEHVTEAVTLFAMWEKNPALTYHANGGSFSSTPEKTYPLPGSTVDVELSKNLPKRSGYDFAGWATTSDAEEPAYTTSGETSFTMGDDPVTLYAVWTPQDIKVNFEKSSNYKIEKKTGEGPDDFSEVEYDDNNISKNEVVKYEGDYTFRVGVYDYIDSESMAVYVNGALQVTPDAAIKDNMKYYTYTLSSVKTEQNIVIQNCNAKQYNVSFKGAENAVIKVTVDENEETLTGNSMTYTYGIGLTLPTAANVTRTGYTFAGWYKEETLDNPVTEIEATESGDKEFYAKWTPKTYQVTLHTNFGGGNTEKTSGPISFTYDIPQAITKIAELSDFTYPDGTAKFLGWSTNQSATTPEYLDGSEVINLATGESDDTDVTLYAVWDLPTWSLVLDANGGTFSEAVGETPTSLTTKSAGSYRQGLDAEIETTAPSRKGYTFKGFAATPGATDTKYTLDENNKFTILAGDANGDCVLYAVWEAKTYNIIFDGNGGSYTEVDSPADPILKETVLYTYDKAQSLWTNQFTYEKVAASAPDPEESEAQPDPEYYVFLGWSKEQKAIDAADLTPTYLDGQSVMNLCSCTADDESITLYAVWGQPGTT